MKDFTIYFSNPWLLLLLLPALALTLIPYFKMPKRYRRTRNRIVSMVLHLVVTLLVTSLLAGIEFRYTLPNNENELIILVDVSETEAQSEEIRDEFVEYVIEDCKEEGVKIGVVTFGFEQNYVVPLTNNVNGIYADYLNALSDDSIDTSATNIASALRYAKKLFTNPQTSKILLVTDGKETDENARDEIAAIVAQGTRVDVAYIPSAFEGADAQFISAELPNYHVNVKEECEIKVTVRSKESATATIELYDNDKKSSEQTVTLNGKTQTFTFEHTFESEGLHELRFDMIYQDLLQENNVFTTYLNLEMYNKILILDREAITPQDGDEGTLGDSEKLIDLLNSKDNETPYVIEVINVEDAPMDVNKLRMYDQVILNNIAKDDMPKDFIKILESYVSDYGGGMFTFGGQDERGKANMYNRNDLFGSLYQEMLPVEAIEYTPPVGVVFIVDRSGSMDGKVDKDNTALQLATACVQSSLSALSERDYIGVVTMDTVPEVILDITPRSQERLIRERIAKIDGATGQTVLSGSLLAARDMLGRYEVDRKHIILITDGAISDNDEDCMDYVESMYREQGITFSALGVSAGNKIDSEALENLQNIVTLGNPEGVDMERALKQPKNAAEAITAVQAQLNTEAIKAVNYNTFNPYIYASSLASPIVQGIEHVVNDDGKEDLFKLNFTLDGFYGTRLKKDAELILVGDYNVPIYAQRKYGLGMVGSFMCDVRGLSGDFSADLMTDSNGGKFLRNAINGVMPTVSIRPDRIVYDLKSENYFNEINVYGMLEKGQKIVGELIRVEDGKEVVVSLNEVTTGEKKYLPVYVTVALGVNNNYSRCEFVVREGGVYRLVLKKCDEQGNVLMEDDEKIQVEAFKTFSYSSEFDSFKNEEEKLIYENLQKIAKSGDGAVIADLEDPWEILSGFKTAIKKTFDPRYLFAILAIVAFLLDIAVRKFKFKWIHEIIRERKAKTKFK